MYDMHSKSAGVTVDSLCRPVFGKDKAMLQQPAV